MTPATPPCAERCYPASDFLLGHFRVFGIFLGILFTKNVLQNVLQGISAERTIFSIIVFANPLHHHPLQILPQIIILAINITSFLTSGKERFIGVEDEATGFWVGGSADTGSSIIS